MTRIEQYCIAVGERGWIVLPASPRRHLNLHPGDRTIATVGADGEARLFSAREHARRLRGPCSAVAPGRSLADELIAERHTEAAWEETS